MKAALLIDTGFEEAEVVIVYDILRRLGIDVDIISCSGSITTSAYFSLSVNADKRIEEITEFVYDAVIIPAGLTPRYRYQEPTCDPFYPAT